MKPRLRLPASPLGRGIGLILALEDLCLSRTIWLILLTLMDGTDLYIFGDAVLTVHFVSGALLVSEDLDLRQRAERPIQSRCQSCVSS
jgi:hypothetical protein